MYFLVKNTMARSGLGFVSKEYFENFYKNNVLNCKIFVVRNGAEIQVGALIPYSQEGAYYLYGGSIEKPILGSMNLLQWEIIKHFKNKLCNSEV